MINEIKKIIQNYLDNAKLCNIVIGTVESNGIRINEKLLIPYELVTGNLKNNLTLDTMLGKRVRLLRNHGGQQFYILEVINE